jgi:hypothetical protein
METSARPDAVVSSRHWTVEAHATFGDGDSHDEHLVWLIRPSSPAGGRYTRKLQCHAARPMKAKDGQRETGDASAFHMATHDQSPLITAPFRFVFQYDELLGERGRHSAGMERGVMLEGVEASGETGVPHVDARFPSWHACGAGSHLHLDPPILNSCSARPLWHHTITTTSCWPERYCASCPSLSGIVSARPFGYWEI